MAGEAGGLAQGNIAICSEVQKESYSLRVHKVCMFSIPARNQASKSAGASSGRRTSLSSPCALRASWRPLEEDVLTLI